MRRPRFCQKGSIRAAGKGQREKHAGRHERALRKRSCPSVLPLIPGVMCPHPQGQQEISLKNPQPLQKIITVGCAAFAFWFPGLWGWCFHAFLGRHQKCTYLFLMKNTIPALFWG